MKFHITIPADVPASHEHEYHHNYEAITHSTGRLMLFAADQKIEHLNQDFYGPTLDATINNPEHLFNIAAQGRVGAFTTYLGLIARYGKQYPPINYIVKMNGKTNLVPTHQKEPLSKQLWSLEQIIDFKKKSGLPIRGVGYTIYLGSAFETEMLQEAARLIYDAHQEGLITILWMYPRGAAINNEYDGALIAGAAGVAAALGTDFAKIIPPAPSNNKTSEQWLAVAQQAAGTTQLICSGGKTKEPHEFLKELYDQLHHGHIHGNATGRNIFSYPLPQAIAMTRAIAALTIENASVDQALTLLAV
jgi:fructose-bisphosphate aldolase/6-deoxy-5-ketofructose 1-phosphate synthase